MSKIARLMEATNAHREALRASKHERANVIAFPQPSIPKDSMDRAVAAALTLRGTDALEMYTRLFRFAKKLKCDDDLAHDMASKAFCIGLEKQNADFAYLATVMKHAIFGWRKYVKRHNLDYQWKMSDDDTDGEPMEMRQAFHAASQELSMELAEAARAIEMLPNVMRKIMMLRAAEWTGSEIAVELGVPLKEVEWRTTEARKILRLACNRDNNITKSKYHGVKKVHQRYQASISIDRKYKYLGAFDDPREAARAYDAAALRIYGAKAKLNFPVNGTSPEPANGLQTEPVCKSPEGENPL